MWSIIAARVVVLPDPVVPGHQHHPPRLESKGLHHRGQVQIHEVGDPGHDVAHGDRDGSPLPVHVHAVAPTAGRAVGEVDLVGLAEAADLLLAHERGRVVLGVLRRARRLVELAQFAVDADDRGAADLEVKVGGACFLDLQQQLVDVLHETSPALSRAAPRRGVKRPLHRVSEETARDLRELRDEQAPEGLERTFPVGLDLFQGLPDVGSLVGGRRPDAKPARRPPDR